ncbi:CapA family protein [Caldimonas thermodepolymerans]|uniref:CapA family protein n=1 Tax=Caldimonas thermodepolymerans TaxID=215580 RepID=UPI0022360B44|nr:CapA family protein [Caldimonas thermodepolymerans]UZG44440.1 CapA family protein [Caldimonas thermodepolymerans]
MTSALSLALTGDVIPVRRLAHASPEARAHAEPLFEMLRAADVALGNFEITLSQRGTPLEKLLNIRTDAAVAQDLAPMGFDVLNIANNHTVDYGWEGLEDTKHALLAAGVQPVGVGATLAEASTPVQLEVQGRRVVILGYSCLLPTGMSASERRPGLAPLHVETGYEVDPCYQMEEPGDPSCVRIRTRVREADLARAVADVRRWREHADVLVVTIHWGYGSGEELAEYQQPLAHALIDAGADLIHGHHPHAVHAIGHHRGKPILYSLGTFLGQQIFLPASDAVQALWAGMSPDGYLAQVEVGADGSCALTLTPHTLNAERLPVVATGADFERIAARLQRLSAPHGTEVVVDGGRLRARPAAAPVALTA